MTGSPSDLLALDALERFLDEHGLGSGPTRAWPIGNGASNLTFLVERDGARLVVRRPPPPPLPPSAHDERDDAWAGDLDTGVRRLLEVAAWHL